MKEKKTEENKEKRREHCVKAACARGIINQRAGGGSLSHRHTETNVLSYDDYSFYLSRSFYSFLPSQSPGDLQEISPATRSIRNAFNRRPESSIRILFEYWSIISPFGRESQKYAAVELRTSRFISRLRSYLDICIVLSVSR